MIENLFIAMIGFVIASVFSMPLIIWALARRRNQPPSGPRRALKYAGLNALVVGLSMGALGFILGAGVPDENAGAAAIWLGTVALCVGGVAAFAFTFPFILFWERR